MFEAAEIGHKVGKEEFAKREPELRAALLKAQYDVLRNGAFPVVIVIGGVDGAGKGETVNLLNEWMDPRHIVTRAFGEASDEEAERPPMWRFWRALPPKGRIGILFGSWYTAPIVDRALRRTGSAQMMQSIESIRHFERMLAEEGALVIKFWFHMSKEAQKKRLKSLEKDPKTRWRVAPTDWARFKMYDRFRRISEDALRETSTGEAPWTVIEGTDANYRALTAGQTLLEALRARLGAARTGRERNPVARAAPAVASRAADARNVINTLDYSAKLSRSDYVKQLEKYQGRLNMLTRDARFRSRSVIAVFEGQDAAGKGSSIRRITAAMDARHYQVIPIAAPTEEERAQPYLWRFWRHLPRQGRVTIFDRSWYGRVLVERVEGFCAEADWMRAYHEINDFEEQVVKHDGVLVKFWVAITKEEQLRRFRERQRIEFKQFKITEEDWRNRKKWAAYERAVCDMVERTSTALAPWHLVSANDKLYARISMLKTLCTRLEAALDGERG
ncbi:MAG: polyphosphate:AMP phosphotransferase [Burkholderiales bacterium]